MMFNDLPEGIKQQQRQRIADHIGKDALLAIEHAVKVEHALHGQCGELPGPDEVNRVTQIYCATIIASALESIGDEITLMRKEC